MKLLKKLTILFLLITCTNCEKDDSTDDLFLESDPAIVATIMNENLELPPGSFIINPEEVEIDESITINSSSGVTPISSGQQMTNTISFNAPNGNVNAVGMRFGLTGPIYFVPINTNGNTSGSGAFDFLINDGICSRLSQICHDIRCYEFAQTTAGKISRSNIRDVAMLCGNCNEPSCQDLIDPSDCNTGGGSGSASFTSSLTGNQTGIAFCAGDTISVSGSYWSIASINLPTSGTTNFNGDYYYNSCSTCPAFQLTNSDGGAYIAIAGTGSWNGNSFNIDLTMEDVINNSTFNLNGVINCN